MMVSKTVYCAFLVIALGLGVGIKRWARENSPVENQSTLSTNANGDSGVVPDSNPTTIIQLETTEDAGNKQSVTKNDSVENQSTLSTNGNGDSGVVPDSNPTTIIQLETTEDAGSTVVTESVEEPLDDFIRGLSKFSGKLLKIIAKDLYGNVVCSPISTAMVLLMASFGAEDHVKDKLRSSFMLPKNDSEASIKIISILESLKNVELRLANKVYIAQGFELESKFMNVVKDTFSLETKTTSSTDVSHDYWKIFSTARTTPINGIMFANDRGSNNPFVFVNAAYFKDIWDSKFDPKQTKLRKWMMDENTWKFIPTMYQYGSFFWGELVGVNATFIELPYQRNNLGDAVSMYIILPREIDGIKKSRENFENVTIDELNRVKKLKTVSVFLPTFSSGRFIDIQPALNKLGFKDMFTDAANFTGISSDGRRLKISKIIQESSTQVNEEGSETTYTIDDRVSKLRDKESISKADFNVNHAFMCMIMTESGVTLFSAIIHDPDNMIP